MRETVITINQKLFIQICYQVVVVEILKSVFNKYVFNFLLGYKFVIFYIN